MKDKMINIDAGVKYLVLFMFAAYIGIIIYSGIRSGDEVINLPDWLVMLFTIVFQYFFRRSPKREDDTK